MTDSCAKIINQLIALRHHRGLTQQELADACCLTQSVIARLESKKTTPKLDTLLKIASALGCDLTIQPTIEDSPI